MADSVYKNEWKKLMTPLLEIKDLQASVGDTPILKGINLIINPGEIHAIMGPNGSGKSTMYFLDVAAMRSPAAMC